MKSMKNVHEGRSYGIKEKLLLKISKQLAKMAANNDVCRFFPAYETETPSIILEEMYVQSQQK